MAVLRALLVQQPHERLGSNGADEVRSHDFFSAVDWSTPLWQQPSVYTPTLAAPTDTSNFQMNALARVQADRMRATLEADHSDAESGAESETGVASFKRSNPGQLAKLQLHQALTHRKRGGSSTGSGTNSPSSARAESPMMGGSVRSSTARSAKAAELPAKQEAA